MERTYLKQYPIKKGSEKLVKSIGAAWHQSMRVVLSSAVTVLKFNCKEFSYHSRIAK